VTPVRPRKRRKGGVLWPRNWRCLGELSAMLAGGQGRGGRSGQGFHCANTEPLLERQEALRCSTSFQDHARRTPGEWRDSYGIPSRRRSNNGLIKLGQWSGTRVRVFISFMKGVGLYFFYIACVTLHPLPCLQLFIAELLPYELIRVSWCIVSLSICTTPLLSVKRSNFKAWPNKGRRKTILI